MRRPQLTRRSVDPGLAAAVASVVVGLVLCLVPAGSCQTLDHPVIGTSIVLSPTHFVVVSNDHAVTAPSRSEVDDDMQGSALGAFLDLCTGNGTTVHMWLDYRGWSITRRGTVNFLRRRVGSASRKSLPIATVAISAGKLLAVRGRGPLADATSAPGGVAVRLVTPRSVTCMAFPGASALKDEPRRFKSMTGVLPPSCALDVLCSMLSASASGVRPRVASESRRPLTATPRIRAATTSHSSARSRSAADR
jgi:hypothetical protein